MRSSLASKLVFASCVVGTVALIVWGTFSTAQPTPAPIPPPGDDDDSAATPKVHTPCEIEGKTGLTIGDFDCDSIPDLLDDCPELPEMVNGYRDYDGCPDEPPVEYQQDDMQQQVQVQEVIKAHKDMKDEADKRNLDMLRKLLDTNAEGATVMIEELEKLREANAPPPPPPPPMEDEFFMFEDEEAEESYPEDEEDLYGPWAE